MHKYKSGNRSIPNLYSDVNTTTTTTTTTNRNKIRNMHKKGTIHKKIKQIRTFLFNLF